MTPITIRYKLGFGIFMLLAGGFMLFVGLTLKNPMQLGLGVMNALIGLGFSTQPWFLVYPDRIEVKNVLGMTMKTHSFPGPSDLQIVDDKVQSKSGAFKPVGGWLARAEDFDKLRARLKQS